MRLLRRRLHRTKPKVAPAWLDEALRTSLTRAAASLQVGQPRLHEILSRKDARRDERE